MGIPRRNLFVGGAGIVGATLARTWLAPLPARADDAVASRVHDGFPAQDPPAVGALVGAAHRDVDKVREMVTARPALAKASWDWGFGDWETPLGAASHMGRRDIAEFVLGHGARPSLFSAAMLGQVDVVRAFVRAAPRSQRIRGPHGISLMAHARAGGEEAKDVVAYLEEVGEADLPLPVVDRTPAELEVVAGTYRFGEGDDDRLDVYVDDRGALRIRRGERAGARFLFGTEDPGSFFPTGAEAVRIRFDLSALPARSVSVYDPGLVVTATRE